MLIQERVTSTADPKSEADTTNSVTKFNQPFQKKNLDLKKSRSIAVDDSIHIRQAILQSSQSKSNPEKSSRSHIKNLSLPIINISIDNRYRARKEIFYLI